MTARLSWSCALFLLLPACTYDWNTRTDSQIDASSEGIDGGSPTAAQRDARAPNAPLDASLSESDSGRDANVQVLGDSAVPPSGKLTCADCAPGAACDETSDKVCTCPPGTLDDHGDGSSCTDPCASAGCDANAQCAVTNGVAKCTCDPAYVGDGKSCMFDSSCSQLSCDANASCAVSGATRSCKCNTGYQGSGSTCADIDECAASSSLCGSHGTCTNTPPGSYSCSCSAGFSGPKCDVDACNPSPCGAGFNCQRGAAGATCVPSCAPNCLAGSACTADNQCSLGSTCDPQGKVCILSSCGGGSIAFQGDLNSFKYCASISGSLTIRSTGSPITTWSLPYLKSITGDLISDATTGDVVAPTLTFEALETVGGDVQFGLVSGPQSFLAPQLKSVAGSLTIGMCTFATVDLSKLTTVGKNLLVLGLLRATQINLGALTSVGGTVSASSLPKVAWFTIAGLQNLGTSQSISTIGCSICPNTPLSSYGCGTSTCM